MSSPKTRVAVDEKSEEGSQGTSSFQIQIKAAERSRVSSDAGCHASFGKGGAIESHPAVKSTLQLSAATPPYVARPLSPATSPQDEILLLHSEDTLPPSEVELSLTLTECPEAGTSLRSSEQLLAEIAELKKASRQQEELLAIYSFHFEELERLLYSKASGVFGRGVDYSRAELQLRDVVKRV